MKSILLVTTVLGMANACSKSATPTTDSAAGGAGYQVSGQLTNAPAGTKVYLAELGETQFVSRDTATVDAQGRFTLKGTVPEAGLYQVKVNDANQVLLALDNKTNLQLSGDATKLTDGYVVKGSKDSETLQQLGKAMVQSKHDMAMLEMRYNNSAQAGQADSMKLIESKFYAAQAQNTAVIKQLIR